jgi:hypothetical protein
MVNDDWITPTACHFSHLHSIFMDSFLDAFNLFIQALGDSQSYKIIPRTHVHLENNGVDWTSFFGVVTIQTSRLLIHPVDQFKCGQLYLDECAEATPIVQAKTQILQLRR